MQFNLRGSFVYSHASMPEFDSCTGYCSMFNIVRLCDCENARSLAIDIAALNDVPRRSRWMSLIVVKQEDARPDVRRNMRPSRVIKNCILCDFTFCVYIYSGLFPHFARPDRSCRHFCC